MFRIISLIFAFVCALTGCGNGLDKKLNTSGSDDAYLASLNEAAKKMSDQDKQAWNWAVQGLTRDAIRQRHPNKTLRQIIRWEAKEVLDTYPGRITELETLAPRYDNMLAQLKKIEASETVFSLPSNFFGIQPTVEATVCNGGNLSVSSFRWKAELYINDDRTPVAVDELFDEYTEGLKPGMTTHRKYTVGFLSGNPAWSTLEIQNASSRRVLLTVNPYTAKDFGNRFYLEGAPYEELEQRRASVETAKQLASY